MVGEKMGVLQRIKNFFRKGVKRAGMQINGRELGKITDHPKIGIDPKEYERIAEDFRYYAADFPKVKYIDSYGERMNRQFNSLNVAKTASRRLASIIFNEKCKVTLKAPDAKTENTINLDEANAFLKKNAICE